MHVQLKLISFYMIATFIYLTSSVDPRRNPSFEVNVLRGLEAAEKFEDHYGPMRLVRAWSSVDVTKEHPSSNWWDFKLLELDILFLNSSFLPEGGFLQGGSGSQWGNWPTEWTATWRYFQGDDQPFNFVMEVSVPQDVAANLANAAGDRGPWDFIVLCVSTRLNTTEPHWFFSDANRRSFTAVGAETEGVTRNLTLDKLCIGPTVKDHIGIHQL